MHAPAQPGDSRGARTLSLATAVSAGLAAAKAGVITLTQQMSMEWGEYNIRVNSIAPGFIDSGMSAPYYENQRIRELRGNAVPLKRLGSADDIAECAMFLASDKAGYITGENIAIDGGVIRSVLMQLPRE